MCDISDYAEDIQVLRLPERTLPTEQAISAGGPRKQYSLRGRFGHANVRFRFVLTLREAIMDDTGDVIQNMLDYIAGRCDAAAQERIQKQLQNPGSLECRALHQIRAISEMALSPEMLEKTQQILEDVLPSSESTQAPNWTNRTKGDKPGPQPGSNR
jgi:hypothetical protein